MATLFQLPKTVPLSGSTTYPGAKAYFYQAGTTTPITTYTTAALSVPHANPVVADANGVFAPIFIDEGANATYKLRLNTSTDVLIYEVDNLPATLNQQALGAVLWPRTAAEVSAGVTPTNFYKKPGLVLRYFSGTVGVTDATAAIQAACDQGAQTDGALPYSEEEHYLAGGSKIVIKSNCDFSKSTWNIDNAPAVAVEISTGSATNPTDVLAGLSCKLPKIVNSDKPATGWASQGTGVRLVNTQRCVITLGPVEGFDIGLLMTAYGQGNVYNQISIPSLHNNKVNVKLKIGSTTGWVNENLFIFGACTHESAEGTSVAGTRHVLLEHLAGGNILNNNVFLKPSIEGDVAEYHVEIQGLMNHVLYARWEATTPKLYFNGTPTPANQNTVHSGYVVAAGITVSTAGTAAFNRVTGFMSREALSFSDQGFMLENGSSSAYPVLMAFEAGTAPYAKTRSSTDWAAWLSSQEFKGKRAADNDSRILLDFVNGRVYVGDGTAAPTSYIGRSGSAIGSNAIVIPTTDNTLSLGLSTNRWSGLFATQLRPGGGTPIWTSGSGTPEGAVTAPIGSLFTRTDGGAATTLYVKESGSGNTGWVAK